MGHQREIDGKLGAAGDELLGAIQRIDQKETAAVRRLRKMSALFGQCRDIRKKPCQTFANDPVGGYVRLCDRRSVQLAVDLHCRDRKSTRLNSSHSQISYAVF